MTARIFCLLILLLDIRALSSWYSELVVLRFHRTMDTLAVQLCTSSLPTRTRDFHPLERAHGAQTQKNRFHQPVLTSKKMPENN